MAIFRGVGGSGDSSDNSFLDAVTAQANAASASATSAANSLAAIQETEVTSASFDTSDGVLTLTKTGGATVTADLDGRFLTTHQDISGKADTSGATFTGDVLFNDGVKAKFGTDSDLAIYHTDGGNSVIEETGEGALVLQTNGSAFAVLSDANDYMINATVDGGVSLYNDGNLRFSVGNTIASIALGVNFSVDTDTLYVDSTNDRVGINDSSPSEALDVNGNIAVSGTVDGVDIASLNTTVAGKANLTGANFTGDVTTTGNVGIGTNAPDADLHINNTSGSELRIDTTGGSNVDSVLNFRENGVDRASLYWDGADNDLYLETTAGDIALLPTGNVGIGTDNPDKKLHIKDGNVRIESNFPRLYLTDIGDNPDYSVINNNGKFGIYDDTNTTYRMTIDSLGKVGIGTTSPATNLHVAGGNSGTNQALFRTSSGGGGGLQIVCSDLSVANPLWSINTFFGEELAFGDGTSEHMRIDASGNVGMGITNPAGNLHVSSGTSGDATLILEADTDNNNEADNPKLQLRQDSNLVNGEMYLEGNSGDTATDSLANSLLLEARDSNGNNNIQFVTGGNMSTPTNGTVRMTIRPDGNVGIGTTNPNEALDVVGNIAVSGTVDGRDVATDGSKLDSIKKRTFGNTSPINITTTSPVIIFEGGIAAPNVDALQTMTARFHLRVANASTSNKINNQYYLTKFLYSKGTAGVSIGTATYDSSPSPYNAWYYVSGDKTDIIVPNRGRMATSSAGASSGQVLGSYYDSTNDRTYFRITKFPDATTVYNNVTVYYSVDGFVSSGSYVANNNNYNSRYFSLLAKSLSTNTHQSPDIAIEDSFGRSSTATKFKIEIDFITSLSNLVVNVYDFMGHTEVSP